MGGNSLKRRGANRRKLTQETRLDDSSGPAAIDIVLFHVDGLVEGYRDLYEAHCGPIKPCQVRDLGELRYVLRSIARFAPWAGRILLVVQDRSHIPSWINEEVVSVVVHADFIPSHLLPTFQVSTIQGHLHRIPDLSEQCIQWCDDYFLGGPVSPEFFFDAHGDPRNEVYDSPVWDVLGRVRTDLYMRSLLNTRRVLHESLGSRLAWGTSACFLFPHLPVAIRRSWWAEMVEALNNHPWFAQTITRRARGDVSESFQDVIVDLSFVTWVDMVKRRRLSAVRYLRCVGMQFGRLLGTLAQSFGASSPQVLYGTFKVRNDPVRTEADMTRLARKPPRFYCVNDDAYDHQVDADGRVYHDGFDVHPESLRAFHAAMHRLLPTPCRYEGTADPDDHVGG